jgi:uncharacterized protein (TIGR03067 family)
MNFAALLVTLLQSLISLGIPVDHTPPHTQTNVAQADDLKLLDGTWLPIEAQLGSNKLPDEFLQSVRLVLKSGEYSSHVGDVVDRGKLNVDITATPKTMDIVGTDGPNQGKTIPAIYEFKDGKLRVCYSIGADPRPTEFSTAGGEKYFLATYRRESKLDPLRKLAGRWTNPAGARAEFEEYWSMPAGNAMMGMFRILQNGKAVLYEFLLIEEEDDGVFLRLRHYRPKLLDMDDAPVRAKLVEHSETRFVFTNPDSASPVKVTYEFESNDKTTATVETTRNGQPVTFKFPMVRVHAVEPASDGK